MIAWMVALTMLGLCALALALFIRKVQGMKGGVAAAHAEFLKQVGYPYVSAIGVKIRVDLLKRSG